MRWAARSCTHQWPSLKPANCGKGPGRLVRVSPSGSSSSAAAGSWSSKASRLLRRRLQRRSIGGMRLLAAAKASVRSGPIWPHSSATSQSGSECSRAQRFFGSAGSGRVSPASSARTAARNTPFTTGAKRCSRSRLASSTAVYRRRCRHPVHRPYRAGPHATAAQQRHPRRHLAEAIEPRIEAPALPVAPWASSVARPRPGAELAALGSRSRGQSAQQAHRFEHARPPGRRRPTAESGAIERVAPVSTDSAARATPLLTHGDAFVDQQLPLDQSLPSRPAKTDAALRIQTRPGHLTGKLQPPQAQPT